MQCVIELVSFDACCHHCIVLQREEGRKRGRKNEIKRSNEDEGGGARKGRGCKRMRGNKRRGGGKRQVNKADMRGRDVSREASKGARRTLSAGYDRY